MDQKTIVQNYFRSTDVSFRDSSKATIHIRADTALGPLQAKLRVERYTSTFKPGPIVFTNLKDALLFAEEFRNLAESTFQDDSVGGG